MKVALAGLALVALTGTAASALGNPASQFCAQRGGHVEIEKAASGAERGTCVFADGRRMDEWAFFRNNHRTTAH